MKTEVSKSKQILVIGGHITETSYHRNIKALLVLEPNRILEINWDIDNPIRFAGFGKHWPIRTKCTVSIIGGRINFSTHITKDDRDKHNPKLAQRISFKNTFDLPMFKDLFSKSERKMIFEELNKCLEWNIPIKKKGGSNVSI